MAIIQFSAEIRRHRNGRGFLLSLRVPHDVYLEFRDEILFYGYSPYFHTNGSYANIYPPKYCYEVRSLGPEDTKQHIEFAKFFCTMRYIAYTDTFLPDVINSKD